MRQNSTLSKFDNSNSWVILSPIEQSIKAKIEKIGTPLKDWDINIYRGVLTGFNDAFIISGEKREEILGNCKDDNERKRTEELIRPILRGRDIKRYSYEYADLYLIATFPSKHYDIEKYPAVKEYLLTFGMERLEQTGKEYKINGEKIKARKKTNNKWFETQDSISYWEEFNKPKIIYPDISQKLSFVVDNTGKLLTNTAYFFACPNDKTRIFLLKILNSKLIDWYYRTLSVQLGEKAVRMFSIYFLQLPITTKIVELPNSESEIDFKVCEIYGLSEYETTYINNLEVISHA